MCCACICNTVSLYVDINFLNHSYDIEAYIFHLNILFAVLLVFTCKLFSLFLSFFLCRFALLFSSVLFVNKWWNENLFFPFHIEMCKIWLYLHCMESNTNTQFVVQKYLSLIYDFIGCVGCRWMFVCAYYMDVGENWNSTSFNIFPAFNFSPVKQQEWIVRRTENGKMRKSRVKEKYTKRMKSEKKKGIKHAEQEQKRKTEWTKKKNVQNVKSSIGLLLLCLTFYLAFQ